MEMQVGVLLMIVIMVGLLWRLRQKMQVIEAAVVKPLLVQGIVWLFTVGALIDSLASLFVTNLSLFVAYKYVLLLSLWALVTLLHVNKLEKKQR